MSKMKNLSEIKEQEELICEDVNIFGDVHQESIIDAHKLLVKGLVHPNTTQFTKYAEINEHQGKLRCHQANINTLNGGTVHASSIIIGTCAGGSIYAQDVQIKKITGDTEIYASNSITIDSITSLDTHLTINYKGIPILMSKLNLIEEDIEELTFLLHKAKEDNSPTQKDIETEIQKLQTEIKDIKNSTANAKISIKEKINGKVFINFTLNENKNISYIAQNTQYKPFYIEYYERKIILQPTQTTITL